MSNILKSILFMFGLGLSAALAPLAISAGGPAVVPSAVEARTGIQGFLAYGDLRGHLEPCGCDPATDLGGIKRLAVVIGRERSLHPELGLFSLGNNLPLANETELKVPFLLEADSRLKPTAALLNVTELQRLRDPKAKILASVPAIPFVLSNPKPGSDFSPLAVRVRSDAQFVVMGYTYAAPIAARVQRMNPEMLKSWRKELQQQGSGKQTVLLFAGPREDLQKIVHAKLFETIISSNTSGFDVEPGVAERQDETKLQVMKDPPVWMVPLAGQGFLRGGALLYDEAKPLGDYLKQGKAQEAAPLFRPAKRFTWLDPASSPEDGPFQDLYARYSDAARQAYLGASAERMKDLKETPYAGAAACAVCHAEASKIYTQTKHAHGMQTIQEKHKDEDGECVACHNLGGKEKGGFVSMAASPQFANVQCETCHGPRLAHTKAPMPSADPQKSRAAARAVCTACHNSQHSPEFEPNEYWRRIAHH